MNGFTKHNLKHSSASQINKWAEAPDAWMADYLFGHKGTFGLPARAGIAVEDAVVAVIAKGQSVGEATQEAVARINKEFALKPLSPAEEKRKAGMGEMIELACGALLEYGEPEFEEGFQQKKIELLCKGDGWELPIIGYIDFHYPKHGLIFDLKTTMKMPSKMSVAHKRQAAIYEKSMGNHAVKFLYVTPKKLSFLENDDIAGTLNEIKGILNRQERFLSLGDKEMLAGIVPVSYDTFYWNGLENVRDELYGE